MNWGWKIAITYSLFVVFTLGAVFYVVSTQDVGLVTEDYYKEEIEYQKVIDAKQRNIELEKPIRFEYQGSKRMAIVHVPEDLLSSDFKGTAFFYRPSNKKDDKTMDLQPDSTGLQELDLSGLKRGVWKIRLTVIAAGSSYIVEKDLFI